MNIFSTVGRARSVFVVALLLITVLAVAVFFGLRQIDEPGELTPITIKLKWVHFAGYAGFYMAQEKGFYEDAGLDVTLLPGDFSDPFPDVVGDVMSGRADFGEINGQSLLEAFGEGNDFKAIMATFQLSPHVFFSLKESNITSPGDFAGKKLGLIFDNKMGKILYPSIMEKVGIDPGSATIVPYLDPISVLTSGEVDVADGWRTYQPYQFNQADIEVNMIFPEQYGLRGYDTVVFTSQKMIDENPEIVRAFVHASIKGWEYALLHPEEAVALTMSNVTEESNDDEGFQRFSFNAQAPLIRPTGGKSIGHMDFQQWFNFYNAMESQGLIENEF
ncbi:MAG: ABC transporter substrate-binding protein, partial [Proteobacteria bacterium]|nr:ABC transporter substrate-binding protein [Pseudomonadota bacterium]